MYLKASLNISEQKRDDLGAYKKLENQFETAISDSFINFGM